MDKHKNPEWLNEFAQQCPHKHFKSKVVDRDFLTRKQHLNLLCTPRGYRWEVAYKVSINRTQDGFKGVRDQPKSKFTHPKAHVYNILAELWSLVTPEMIDRMKTMLMEEFGILEDQAVDFMCKKVQETMYFASPRIPTEDGLSLDNNTQKGSNRPRLIQLDLEKSRRLRELGIKPAYVKIFSNVVSKKLAEVVTSSVSTKRTKKQKLLSNFIFESLGKLTGDLCKIDKATTILQRAQAFFADKFAMWILQNEEDEKAQRKKKRALEDARLKKKINAKRRSQE